MRAIGSKNITLLDGAVGTELARRGVDTSGPAWSARAVISAPDVLTAIHNDYAAAGATVHTAATFRTRPQNVGGDWRELTRDAVDLARDAVPKSHRVAGSIGPVEDCYRPDLSPPDAFPQHVAMAEQLALAGVDLLLVETFANPEEAVQAVTAALSTGLPVWCALSSGYRGDLLDAGQMIEAAERLGELGVAHVLVNCTPLPQTTEILDGLRELGMSFGAYANAGGRWPDVGQPHSETAVSRYVAEVRRWVARGARVVGGCCGTGPAHIRAISTELDTR